jgi:hypothetical protein
MTGKLKRVGSSAKVPPTIKTSKADAPREESNGSPKQTPFQRLQLLLASRQPADGVGQVVTSVEGTAVRRLTQICCFSNVFSLPCRAATATA